MSDKPLFHTTVVERKKFLELQWSLQHDIETLLLKFQSKGTFSFIFFCNLWKEMKFGLIYAGKYRTQDFGHYTEMVYYTVKKYFMHSTSLHIQVGALYLIYSLYYKNPFLHLVKVRLVKNEFEKLLEIIAIMQKQGEREVLYVFNKMLLDQVFDFVRGQYSLGLETRFMLADLSLVDNIFRNEDIIIQRIESDTRSAMCKIYKTETEYRELLKQYTEQTNIKISTEPFNLKEDIDQILEKKNEPVPKFEPKPSTSIVDKRREIRSKGFTNKGKQKRAAYMDNFEEDADDF